MLRAPTVAVALPWLVLALGSGARAQPATEPITSRDYVIDLHQGAVLGSVRMVGMGGAAVALAEGSASMLVNPAAPAVRPATSTDTWDWDWHVDWLSPALGSDYDNNGMPTETRLLTAPLVTMGLVGQYRQWGLGVSGLFAQRPIVREDPPSDAAEGDILTPSFEIVRLTLARSFARRRLTVGAGVRTGRFRLARAPAADPGASGQTLFEMTGAALEAGAVWRPRDRDLRVGAAASLPVSSQEVLVQACDPARCAGYILPRAVEVPWELSLGVAWRRGATRWNRKVRARWRDEGYVLVAADVVVTGAVAGGAGIEAFLDQMRQPSGQAPSVSVRSGIEHEWLPGRLRVRGGAYWEPGRFAGVDGRLHGTAGLDWRFWAFRFWGEPYRARLSLTADLAPRYANTGLSIGFWQ